MPAAAEIAIDSGQTYGRVEAPGVQVVPQAPASHATRPAPLPGGEYTLGTPTAPTPQPAPMVQASLPQQVVATPRRPQLGPGPTQAVADLRAATADWVGRKLYVAAPWYKFTNPVTAWVLLAVSQDLGTDSVYFDPEFGDAMVYHARNKLATRFLASGIEWMLTIDDDIVPPFGRANAMRMMCRLPQSYPDELAGVHFVHQLMSHGQTIVGASYYARRPGGPIIASVAGGSDHPLGAQGVTHPGPLIPVDWVGTGCMLIHRSVFEDIQRTFPDLAPPPGYEQLAGWNFFQPLDALHGEDVSFCLRARHAGHQVYLDPSVVCAHIGFGSYTHVPQA